MFFCCRDLVERLHKQGTRVYLVTGGFRVIVEPIAKGLNIPIENIYANEILFDEEGWSSCVSWYFNLSMLFCCSGYFTDS